MFWGFTENPTFRGVVSQKNNIKEGDCLKVGGFDSLLI